MFIAYNSRAYPANEPVLKNLLETREELAHTVASPEDVDEELRHLIAVMKGV